MLQILVFLCVGRTNFSISNFDLEEFDMEPYPNPYTSD